MADPISTIVQAQLLNQLVATCASAYDSQAYENGKSVKGSYGALVGFSGYSSNAAAQFIQVHDSAGTPAAGAVPLIVLTVGATGNFSWNPIRMNKFFKNGIFVGNSTTAQTYTAGAADTWFNVLYL